MVYKLGNATIFQIIELYKKHTSISQIARTLNISKGVVHKYVQNHRQGKLNLPPSLPVTKTHTSVDASHVNIQDAINEDTLKTLHVLSIKEGYASIDECIKRLIDIYINIIMPVSHHRLKLHTQKAGYIPFSWHDYWFGYMISTFLGAVTESIAKSFDKSIELAINAAKPAVIEAIKSQEFLKTYSNMFRKWHDQHQDILLTAKHLKSLPDEAPKEIIEYFSQWLTYKAYPQAKANYDLATIKHSQ